MNSRRSVDSDTPVGHFQLGARRKDAKLELAQLGLRRLNSTTAEMISGRGPLGPGFPRFFVEERSLYFCFFTKWRNRKSVVGRRVTVAFLSR